MKRYRIKDLIWLVVVASLIALQIRSQMQVAHVHHLFQRMSTDRIPEIDYSIQQAETFSTLMLGINSELGRMRENRGHISFENCVIVPNDPAYPSGIKIEGKGITSTMKNTRIEKVLVTKAAIGPKRRRE